MDTKEKLKLLAQKLLDKSSGYVLLKVIRETQPRLAGVARKYSLDPAELENEVFIKLFSYCRKNNIEPSTIKFPFVLRTARSICIDKLRKKKSIERKLDGYFQHKQQEKQKSLLDNIEQNTLHQHVQVLLDELDNKTLHLAELLMQGKSIKAAQRKMGIRKKEINKLLEKLKEKLKQDSFISEYVKIM